MCCPSNKPIGRKEKRNAHGWAASTGFPPTCSCRMLDRIAYWASSVALVLGNRLNMGRKSSKIPLHSKPGIQLDAEKHKGNREGKKLNGNYLLGAPEYINSRISNVTLTCSF